MSDVQVFCRQIRARTAEHREAMRAVAALPGQMFSILRQELDSLVRVIFLLGQQDHDYRNQLINAAVEGRRWNTRGARRHVTDKEMVELAQRLHGWTQSVYKFGCAFIHLSSMHDYRTRDPLKDISDEERNAVLGHLRYYHGSPHQLNPTFQDIVPYLPNVFEKIASNLEYYLTQLEDDGDLDEEPN
jgi:hypothetical protein